MSTQQTYTDLGHFTLSKYVSRQYFQLNIESIKALDEYFKKRRQQKKKDNIANLRKYYDLKISA